MVKTALLFCLIIISASSSLFSNKKDKIVILSDLTGIEIDSTENQNFKIFHDMKSLNYAVFFETNKRFHYVYYVEMIDGNPREGIFWITEAEMLDITKKITGKDKALYSDWKFVDNLSFPGVEKLRNTDKSRKNLNDLSEEVNIEKIRKKAQRDFWYIYTYEFIYEKASLDYVEDDKLAIWLDGKFYLINIEDIEYIKYDANNKFSQVVFGALTGLVSGAIIGHLSNNIAGNDNSNFGRMNSSTYYGGLFGSIIGGSIGAAIKTEDDNYDLSGKSLREKINFISDFLVGIN